MSSLEQMAQAIVHEGSPGGRSSSASRTVFTYSLHCKKCQKFGHHTTKCINLVYALAL